MWLRRLTGHISGDNTPPRRLLSRKRTVWPSIWSHARRDHPMKAVSPELLELVHKTAPPVAEIVPLPWAYEHEDHNIAVIVQDIVAYEEARQIEDRLIDAIMDYDAAHGTFTVCLVWREQEKTYAGVQ
jgi:hypothetical protein